MNSFPGQLEYASLKLKMQWNSELSTLTVGAIGNDNPVAIVTYLN